MDAGHPVRRESQDRALSSTKKPEIAKGANIEGLADQAVPGPSKEATDRGAVNLVPSDIDPTINELGSWPAKEPAPCAKHEFVVDSVISNEKQRQYYRQRAAIKETDPFPVSARPTRSQTANIRNQRPEILDRTNTHTSFEKTAKVTSFPERVEIAAHHMKPARTRTSVAAKNAPIFFPNLCTYSTPKAAVDGSPKPSINPMYEAAKKAAIRKEELENRKRNMKYQRKARASAQSRKIGQSKSNKMTKPNSVKKEKRYHKAPLRAYLKEALKNAPLGHFPNLKIGTMRPEATDLVDETQSHRSKERPSDLSSTIIVDLTSFDMEESENMGSRNEVSADSDDSAVASDTMSTSNDDEADRVALWSVFADAYAEVVAVEATKTT